MSKRHFFYDHYRGYRGGDGDRHRGRCGGEAHTGGHGVREVRATIQGTLVGWAAVVGPVCPANESTSGEEVPAWVFAFTSTCPAV